MKVYMLTGLLALSPFAAHAIVVGGAVTGGTALDAGGTFQLLDANTPFSVGNNTFDNNNLYAFNENQNIAVSAAVPVDVGTAPQTGDTVASHYVFFDPFNGTQSGYVDFDAEIYGIATATPVLEQSDFLQNNAVTYLNPTFRGLEAGDSVSIDPAMPSRLLVNWAASTPGDYVRVFTQFSAGAVDPIIPNPMPDPDPDPDPDPGTGGEMHAVPLPATVWLFGAALAGLLGFRRSAGQRAA